MIERPITNFPDLGYELTTFQHGSDCGQVDLSVKHLLKVKKFGTILEKDFSGESGCSTNSFDLGSSVFETLAARKLWLHFEPESLNSIGIASLRFCDLENTWTADCLRALVMADMGPFMKSSVPPFSVEGVSKCNNDCQL